MQSRHGRALVLLLLLATAGGALSSPAQTVHVLAEPSPFKDVFVLSLAQDPGHLGGAQGVPVIDHHQHSICLTQAALGPGTVHAIALEHQIAVTLLQVIEPVSKLEALTAIQCPQVRPFTTFLTQAIGIQPQGEIELGQRLG